MGPKTKPGELWVWKGTEWRNPIAVEVLDQSINTDDEGNWWPKIAPIDGVGQSYCSENDLVARVPTVADDHRIRV